MEIRTPTHTPRSLASMAGNIYHVLTGKTFPGRISVEFYRYTRLKNTIRERDGALKIRISDLLTDAPERILKSLLYILFCKLMGRQCPEHYRDCYRSYIYSGSVAGMDRTQHRRREKERDASAHGAVYDLDEIYARVNRDYFDGVGPEPTLTWSKRETYRTFGSHDNVFGTVTISRSLDATEVPLFVVEYVMYHELLHCAIGIDYINGRRRVHPPAFRDRERQFERYEAAERWLKRFAARKRRELS